MKSNKKKVNLAKALTKNKNCLGYIVRFNNGKHMYQNDNDLGLDLEYLDMDIEYEKKIFVYKRFYIYYIVDNIEDDGNGIDLDVAIALLKECHENIIPLSEKEKEKCNNYWKPFLGENYAKRI